MPTRSKKSNRPAKNKLPPLKNQDKASSQIRELQSANKKLQDRVQDLNSFVYKAAHDLKGPLSSMSGLVGLAAEELKENSRAMDFISRIRDCNSKLDALLNDLLAVTHISHSRSAIRNVNISSLFNDILKSLSNFPGREAVLVKSDMRMKKAFSGDVSALSGILQNLLQNSIAYRSSDRDSFVNVKIDGDGKQLIIEVSDNGKGIPAALQKKVFDMFFRADETSKGSGLGLYIVKLAVDKMRGALQLESNEGKGTTVTIRIPQ